MRDYFSCIIHALKCPYLTNHETDDCSKESKHPESRRKSWNKVEHGAEKATHKQRELPAKLVRDRADRNTTSYKSSKDHGGWYKSKCASFAIKIKLSKEKVIETNKQNRKDSSFIQVGEDSLTSRRLAVGKCLHEKTRSPLGESILPSPYRYFW